MPRQVRYYESIPTRPLKHRPPPPTMDKKEQQNTALP